MHGPVAVGRLDPPIDQCRVRPDGPDLTGQVVLLVERHRPDDAGAGEVTDAREGEVGLAAQLVDDGGGGLEARCRLEAELPERSRNLLKGRVRLEKHLLEVPEVSSAGDLVLPEPLTQERLLLPRQCHRPSSWPLVTYSASDATGITAAGGEPSTISDGLA